MLLPLGSIVYLADGNQKVVIIGRGMIVNQEGADVVFDYTGQALFFQTVSIQKRFIILTKKILTKSYLKVTVMMRKNAMQSFIYNG